MEKVVFLDRDGVICEDKNFICKKEDVIMIPRAADAIKILNENDYKIIIITNQPAVARGLCSEDTIIEIDRYLKELLKEENAFIDKTYYCPHHPIKGVNPNYTKECDCRKPKPGLIFQAKKEFGIKELNECYVIGDKIGDIKTGDNAGCKTILVETGYGGKDGFDDAVPMYTVKDLYEAAKLILSKNNEKKPKLFINTGGKGERLYPLTKDIPKPLVPVCEKPVLHHLVDWAKNNGIKEIVMMNGHMAEKIIDYFKDGSRFGIKIIHSNEPYPLGSGGPLKFAKKHIEGKLIHISGDQICDVNLIRMLDFHEKNNSQMTVLVHKSTHPYDSDILEIDETGKILKFISKHDDHTGVGDLTNAGLAIIEPEIIDLMNEEVFNFENYLYPILLKNNIKFYAYYTDEFMHDMGTLDKLKRCEEYLKNKQNSR